MFWILGIIIVVVFLYFLSLENNKSEEHSQNFVSELTKEFRKGFNTEQKAAIIGSMIIVSKTPNGLLPKEEQFIEVTAHSLGINLADPALSAISKKGKVNLISVLNTLSKDSKEWFAYTLYSLLSFYGKPEEKKVQIALTLLNDIGISENDFVRIVENTKEIHRRFFQ